MDKDKKPKTGQKEGEDGENRERADEEEKLAVTTTGTTVSQKSSPCWTPLSVCSMLFVTLK